MTQRVHLLTRIVATSTLAGAVVLLATGCSFVQRQIGDAWAVTYVVQVDQPKGATLSDLSVDGAPGRGDAPAVHELGTRKTNAAHGTGSRWTHESVVLAKQQASVRATPAPGATATCRILLDGKREIATATSSAPGEPVRCSVTTPAFG